MMGRARTAKTMAASRTVPVTLGVAAALLLTSFLAWAAAGAPGAPTWMRPGGGHAHGASMGADASGMDAMHEGMSDGSMQGTTVMMMHSEFMPALLRVRVGETVTWMNHDGVAHTITSDEGDELDSGLVGPNASWSHTFSQPGTYRYHCEPHAREGQGGAYEGMVGAVEVVA